MRYVASMFALLFLLHHQSYSQLLEEQFSYPVGDSLTSHGWAAHSGGGASPLIVTSPGLSFPAFPGSGIGNATTIAGGSGSREDVNRTFAVQASGTVYVSFLVNVGSASTTADYFLHLARTSVGTFYALVWVDRDPSNPSLVAFGVSKTSSGPAAFTSFSYPTNTTYLFVLKYTFLGITSDDDEVSLHVLTTAAPTSEPLAPTVGPVAGANDVVDLASVALRQGTPTHTVSVDGIIVGTSWPEVALPVQLASFTGQSLGSSVRLDWTTLSEVQNFGFYVQRRNEALRSWVDLPGAFVPGNGTTTQPHSYSHNDETAMPGQQHYRLRQVDYDGTSHYSDAITVDVITTVGKEIPVKFKLNQNFPNPFNPGTSISFSVDSFAPTKVLIYNILGQPVATLFEAYGQPGYLYTVQWDASDFPSGLYFYKLINGGKSDIKKMSLVR